MGERLTVDSVMTPDGEVMPLGPVDKEGCCVPLDTDVLYDEDGCVIILGESGYSVCDECLRQARIEREWENEQCAEERLVCPYCESSIDDPWYYDEDDEEVVCPECKRTFELEITTVRTYRTKRRIEDMPDGWNGGELL